MRQDNPGIFEIRNQLIAALGGRQRLIAFPELGIGFYPPEPGKVIYDESYWLKYVKYENTDLGDQLTRYRINFVADFYTGPVVDIGIGSGQFVKMREEPTFGYDVNPHAVDWLKANGKYRNVYSDRWEAMTFWDSLEHVEYFPAMLSRIEKWAFIAMPIYETVDSVPKSKHFRPNEHIWYFTDAGLRWIMAQLGFECRAQTNGESVLGRDDIWSYSFERVRE